MLIYHGDLILLLNSFQNVTHSFKLRKQSCYHHFIILPKIIEQDEQTILFGVILEFMQFFKTQTKRGIN